MQPASLIDTVTEWTRRCIDRERTNKARREVGPEPSTGYKSLLFGLDFVRTEDLLVVVEGFLR